MTDSLKSINTRKVSSTPQSQKAVKGQKKNAAGGYVFKIDDIERAKRFLILGSENNFYTPGVELSKQNAKTLIKLAEASPESGKALVDLIVAVSTEGRAPKVNPAIFALAISSSFGEQESKSYALSKLPAVLRTGTHLFQYATYVQQFRGWGRGLKNAVARWYTEKDADKLAYQVVKYQSREGWTHRDLFRLSHPETKNPALHGLGEWILRSDSSEAPRLVEGFVKAHQENADIPALIREYGLSWEMVPTESLNEVDTWKALLDGSLPLGALLRQLSRLTRIGLLAPLSTEAGAIVKRLTDKAEIERARIHPIAILQAMKTYASGRSERGSGVWTPNQKIVSALDKAFYLAFKNVEPANKRTLIGLDVSGSMGVAATPGSSLTARDASAAIALVTAATEPSTQVIGFTGGSNGGFGWGATRRATPAGTSKYASSVTELSHVVSEGRRLDDVVRDISGLPFGSTDCSLPMLYAMEQGLKVDTFLVITDNDTWAGSVHAHEALAQYRKATGIDAKLIVLATQATPFSIADPKDPGMLDIAGFDSAAPALVADFSRGI
jgi:60 kDa SS-A/Ro ribonucleoprotein